MCSLEFPDLQRQISLPYADQGLVVLGVSGDGLFGTEDRQTLTRFVEQTQVSFPILVGDKNLRAYGKGGPRISPFPFDVIIDRQGKIRYLGTRFDAAAMKSVVEQALAE